MQPTLSMICAMTHDGVIGKNNELPWHLPADFAWFKQHTLNKPIIMGRKTFESIGRPLPKRRNMVISRSPCTIENVECFTSVEAALQALAKDNVAEAMLIGGGELFRQYLPLAQRLYLTLIDAKIAGDTFFPAVDYKDWQVKQEQHHPRDDKNPYAMVFQILERR